MNHARVLYHMVRADFLERVRRYSFLLTLGFAVYLGYAVYAGQIVVQLGDYRGIYNSAWLGCVMMLVTSTFLTLVGFYLVKNTIQRDRQTRVGQILATTPMSKPFYTLAKTISNFAVLAAMVLIMACAGLFMQMLQGEDRHVHILQLAGPLVVFGLSAMAVTAALAVLFETLPGLRSGLGNVIYFFVWITLLALGAGNVDKARRANQQAYFPDYAGLAIVLGQMQARLRQIDRLYQGGASINAGSSGNPATKHFLWTGLHWNWAILLSRLEWIAVAAGLALLAASFFDRFDPARQWRSAAAMQPAQAPPPGTQEIFASATQSAQPTVHLAPLDRGRNRTRFLSTVAAELRLMLKGRSWWWYAVAAGLFIACLASPLDAARGGVLIAAWVWPTLLWSPMGSREARYGTQSLIFSSQHALQRQLPAAWLAGVVVALVAGGGVGLRLLLSANWMGLSAWIAGAIFIPSLALALGVWTQSSKTFEALYTVWWYIGAAHHIPGLDFMGTTTASSTPGIYLVAGIVLFAAAYLGRYVRLARG